MLRCWMSVLGPIKTKDGSFLKVKALPCPNAMECILYLGEVTFKKETTRITGEGLLTDADPLGPDKMLRYLSVKCKHPQKHNIMLHIASLEPVGVLIPHHMLKLMSRYAKMLEERG